MYKSESTWPPVWAINANEDPDRVDPEPGECIECGADIMDADYCPTHEPKEITV